MMAADSPTAPSATADKLFTVHKGFDFIGFDGDIGRQVAGLSLGDEDVVFKPYAAPLLPDIDAGFSG